MWILEFVMCLDFDDEGKCGHMNLYQRSSFGLGRTPAVTISVLACLLCGVYLASIGVPIWKAFGATLGLFVFIDRVWAGTR